MNARQITKLCGLGALTACLFVSASASAEEQKRPLSMTYQLLGIKAETAKPAATSENRCAALTWVTSIGACGRDLLAKILPRTERIAHAPSGEDDASAAASDTRVATEPGLPRSDVVATMQLPTLVSAQQPRAARTPLMRDALLGSNRSADLLLRVGSKHRYSPSEESFTDANYQAHVQNNAHKALGVELLVPFQ